MNLEFFVYRTMNKCGDFKFEKSLIAWVLDMLEFGIRLSCISLFITAPGLDSFCTNNFVLVQSPPLQNSSSAPISMRYHLCFFAFIFSARMKKNNRL